MCITLTYFFIVGTESKNFTNWINKGRLWREIYLAEDFRIWFFEMATSKWKKIKIFCESHWLLFGIKYCVSMYRSLWSNSVHINVKIKQQAILKEKQDHVVLKMQCSHMTGNLPSLLFLSKTNVIAFWWHCIFRKRFYVSFSKQHK